MAFSDDGGKRGDLLVKSGSMIPDGTGNRSVGVNGCPT